jgi:hypothetical protein
MPLNKTINYTDLIYEITYIIVIHLKKALLKAGSISLIFFVCSLSFRDVFSVINLFMKKLIYHQVIVDGISV